MNSLAAVTPPIVDGQQITADAVFSLGLMDSYRHWSETLPVVPVILSRLAEVLTLSVPDLHCNRPLFHTALMRGAAQADQWQVLGNSLSLTRGSVSAVLVAALDAAGYEVRAGEREWLISDQRPLIAWLSDPDQQRDPIRIGHRTTSMATAHAALRAMLRTHVWDTGCEALLRASFDDLCPPR